MLLYRLKSVDTKLHKDWRAYGVVHSKPELALLGMLVLHAALSARCMRSQGAWKIASEAAGGLTGISMDPCSR